MAKTKTRSRNNSKDILRSANAPLVKSALPSRSQKSTEDLLAEAATLLEHSQPDEALPLVQEALQRLEADKPAYSDIDILLQTAAQEKATFPTALVLGADICSALGDIDKARAQYELAVRLDPDGALVSAEPYLELAQLCEEGGRKSVAYFEKAVEVIKNEIDALDEQMDVEGTQQIVDLRRSKLADALCAIAEIYMTDLSWEDDAEQRCEQLVTEAVAICPETLSAGVLQTLASIRISQERVDEARRTLAQSLSVWMDIPADTEHLARPDFATRVSLVRLLMEVEQEQDAMIVLEGLVKEDDQSVESWYLGGWCHLLISNKPDTAEDTTSTYAQQAREWLANCLKLYQVLQYEDEPLRHHAEELVQQLNTSLNIAESEDEWEDADDNDNELDGDDIEAVDADHSRGEDVEMT
ncbi:hypothetical protein LTR70_005608 [Exophiala xenobiotica]|uniref:Uncharacterized protein n=1 Tax=Lithohypha guttulata TaxID=1690604 RepID=A0ABR0K9C1_9EURO|nr:hypothetical protein LTR24_005324 [Lithohypha guttulata]KAK5318025.1 hypothetical protein LTR70_005608 [Exophiala xenobiotica]